MSKDQPTPDETLQQEFNRWAHAGEGEKMEQHHLDITQKTLRLMDLRPGQRILDLGCGSGWATRLLARAVNTRAGGGGVVGVDVSDEIVRVARENSVGLPHIEYICAPATNIPRPDCFFDRVLSVESFYYYPDQSQALDELFRVMAPEGRLFILINLYTDNSYSLQWVHKLKVPVHVRSEAEYLEMLTQQGFVDAQAYRIPDDTPTPDHYQTTSFHSLQDMRAFKSIGALLLTAAKPAARRAR
jgi:ubiquinone/menaquinone biosynthesis C-methylase UbiE